MRNIGTSRLVFTFLATIYLVGLCAPLYAVSTVFDSFYRTHFSNKEANIEISTMGG